LPRVAGEGRSRLVSKYPSAGRLPTRAAEALERFLEMQRIAGLDEPAMSRLVDWLLAGLQGARVTVLTPICPDYEAHKIGPNLYRYTFARLGSRVGVVGRR